ncbi:serine hydrolase [bacterium]|nr:serine hydrolase [bacterium]
MGEEQLNRFVQSLGISGVGKITSIGHLDREIMRRIDPRFADVPFHLLERWMRGGEVEAIVPEYFERDPRTTAAYRLRYHGAYQDYYASGWNSATPRAVGTLLERIARGKVVSASACGHMLDTMGRSSAPRMGRRLPPTVWTYSKDGGKYRVTCSAGIVREGTFEMVVGAFTQNCDRDAGGRLVAEAAELAYRLLRPADLRLPPLSATPERLSPLFLLRDEHSQAIWNRHGQDERALVAARRAAARNRFTAGQLVGAAVSADGLPADLPLVVAADGPDGAHVRYQNVLRAGQVSSWTPGFTPTRPGTWTISFYCQGTPVRSATCTIAPATRRTP